MVLKRAKYGFNTGSTLRRKCECFKQRKQDILLVNESGARSSEILYSVLDNLWSRMAFHSHYFSFYRFYDSFYDLKYFIEKLIEFIQVIPDSNVHYSLKKLKLYEYEKWSFLENVWDTVRDIYKLQQSKEFVQCCQENLFNGVIPAQLLYKESFGQKPLSVIGGDEIKVDFCTKQVKATKYNLKDLSDQNADSLKHDQEV